jgi:hypothetical protein
LLGLLSNRGISLFLPVIVTFLAGLLYSSNIAIPVLKLEHVYYLSWTIVVLLFAQILNQAETAPLLKKKMF